MKLTNREKNHIRYLNKTGYSVRQLLETYDVSERTIRRIIGKSKDYEDDDTEIVDENVRLAKQVQRQQDINRIKNKSFRESARISNAIDEYGLRLLSILEKNTLSSLAVKHDIPESEEVVGIVHLSDIHFNEQINLETNTYNFEVASKRIKKLITRAKIQFNAMGVTTVIVAMTGDMMNSDRRLDELLENSTNRSKATFLAVDILQQAILDLNKDYNVTVASICGNEGRVNKDIGWIDQIASDNYDYTIHQVLTYLFREAEGITFLPIDNPLEKVINVLGRHILMIHGHNGISTNANIEGGVTKTISRYAMAGIKLDYVIMGHIHLANIGDFYARSGGLPGANSYSQNALNLYSRASQNIYFVTTDSIDGMKIDLQDTNGYSGYSFDSGLESYHSKSDMKSKERDIVIHKIVI